MPAVMPPSSVPAAIIILVQGFCCRVLEGLHRLLLLCAVRWTTGFASETFCANTRSRHCPHTSGSTTPLTHATGRRPVFPVSCEADGSARLTLGWRTLTSGCGTSLQRQYPHCYPDALWKTTAIRRVVSIGVRLNVMSCQRIDCRGMRSTHTKNGRPSMPMIPMGAWATQHQFSFCRTPVTCARPCTVNISDRFSGQVAIPVLTETQCDGTRL